MQRKRGFELGRPLGLPLFVHASFVPAGALLTTHLAITAYGPRSLPVAVLLGIATVAALFACIVFHTIAHRIVGGRRPATPVVYIFGDVESDLPTAPPTRRDVAGALAGPLASAAIGVALIAAAAAAPGWLHPFARTIGLANLALAAINLVPAAPFDGGRAAVFARARSGRTLRSAVRTTGRLGQVLGVLLVVGGIGLLARGGSLVQSAAIGLWLVLTGIFVATKATAFRRATPAGPDLDGRVVGDWTKPFAGRIDADAPVPDDAGTYAVSDRGHLAGVVTTAMKTLPSQHARDVMVPWSASISVQTREPLEHGLRRLARKQTPFLVVLDDEGVVRGVLDADGVRDQLAHT